MHLIIISLLLKYHTITIKIQKLYIRLIRALVNRFKLKNTNIEESSTRGKAEKFVHRTAKVTIERRELPSCRLVRIAARLQIAVTRLNQATKPMEGIDESG